MALLFPPRHQVGALGKRGEHPRNLGGVILQVGVERDDDITLCLGEAGGECRPLPEVASHLDDADLFVKRRKTREHHVAAIA